jgi:transposase IS66 family protein
MRMATPASGLYEVDPKRGEPRLVEVACWSHVRRKVYDVHVETGAPLAKEALERIAIEAGINGRSPTERVAGRRLNQSRALSISNDSFELRSERSVPRARSLARSGTLCRAGVRSRSTRAMADWK